MLRIPSTSSHVMIMSRGIKLIKFNDIIHLHKVIKISNQQLKKRHMIESHDVVNLKHWSTILTSHIRFEESISCQIKHEKDEKYLFGWKN